MSKNRKFCIKIRRFVETVANLLFSWFNSIRGYINKKFFFQKSIDEHPKKANKTIVKGGEYLKNFIIK